MLLINAISVKLFLTFPCKMVQNSGSAAWIQSIYVSLLALLIFLGTYKLYHACGKKDIIELSECISGRWLKILTGVLVCAVLAVNISMTVRIFPESIKIYLLPTTPTEFILLFLAIAAAIGAFCGIEALSRLHAFIIPISALIMGIFFLMVLPECRINNLFPVLGTGAYNVFVKGFNWVSIFADILLLNLLIPYTENRQTAVRCGLTAIIAGGICAFVITLLYTMAYPYPISGQFIMPVYQLMRLVKLGEFFQRAEAIFEFVWSVSTMMYISVYISVICLVWQKCFDLKFHKAVIAPVTTIIFAVAFMPPSINVILENDMIMKNIIYPIAFLLPIIFALLYRRKIKKEGQKIEKS